MAIPIHDFMVTVQFYDYLRERSRTCPVAWEQYVRLHKKFKHDRRMKQFHKELQQ
jgi:hypothetical protein